MKEILRIEYDHDALTIMDNINEILKKHNLEFKCDDLPHDGFEIYELIKKELENG